jgi:endonuclease/exonuclease/phosphatase family metal-dependent hydrolase
MTRLRVLSWNLHGVMTAPRIEERVALAADEILRRRPAVVLLQEIWRKSEAVVLEEKFEAKGYRTLLTPEPGAIIRTAGLHAFVDGAAGWKFGADGFEAFVENAPAWKVWEGDALGDKGVQWFRVEGHGTAAWILNTHLQAAYEPGGYAEIRRAQLRQLTARSEALLAKQPLPLIAAGDLNTRPDEPGFEEISAAWQDLTRGVRDECDCGTVAGAKEEGWIDYILARTIDGTALDARVELIVNRAPDDPYSDHDGLQAALRRQCRIHALQQRLPLAGETGRKAHPVAVELHVAEEVAAVDVEVEEGLGAPREVSGPALDEAVASPQLAQQRLQGNEVSRLGVAHLLPSAAGGCPPGAPPLRPCRPTRAATP